MPIKGLESAIFESDTGDVVGAAMAEGLTGFDILSDEERNQNPGSAVVGRLAGEIVAMIPAFRAGRAVVGGLAASKLAGGKTAQFLGEAALRGASRKEFVKIFKEEGADAAMAIMKNSRLRNKVGQVALVEALGGLVFAAGQETLKAAAPGQDVDLERLVTEPLLFGAFGGAAAGIGRGVSRLRGNKGPRFGTGALAELKAELGKPAKPKQLLPPSTPPPKQLLPPQEVKQLEFKPDGTVKHGPGGEFTARDLQFSDKPKQLVFREGQKTFGHTPLKRQSRGPTIILGSKPDAKRIIIPAIQNVATKGGDRQVLAFAKSGSDPMNLKVITDLNTFQPKLVSDLSKAAKPDVQIITRNIMEPLDQITRQLTAKLNKPPTTLAKGVADVTKTQVGLNKAEKLKQHIASQLEIQRKILSDGWKSLSTDQKRAIGAQLVITGAAYGDNYLGYTPEEGETTAYNYESAGLGKFGVASGVVVGLGMLGRAGRSKRLKAVFDAAGKTFLQSRSLIKTEAGKLVPDLLEKNQKVGHRIAAEKIAKLFEDIEVTATVTKTGGKGKFRIKDLDDIQAEELAERIEKGLEPEVSKFLLAVRNEAKAAGVPVSGIIKHGYFPQRLRGEFREKMYDELFELQRKLAPENELSTPSRIGASIAGIGRVRTERDASELIRSMMKNGEIGPELSAQINHILKTGGRAVKKGRGKKATTEIVGFDNEFQALEALQKYINSHVFNPADNLLPEFGVDLIRKAGSLEKSRALFKLKGDVYERNAKEVLAGYLKAAGERISAAKVYGKNNVHLEGLLRRVGRESRNEEALLRTLIKASEGKLDQEAKYALGPNARQIFDSLTSFQLTFKIGTGFGTLLNLSQAFISVFPKVGLVRGLKAVSKWAARSDTRLLKETGAINDHFLDAVIGTNPASKLHAIRDKMLTVSGFRGINRINQEISALAGEVFVKDLYKIANSTSGSAQRKAWARDTLEKTFLVKHTDKLTDEVIKESMFRFANNSQLQKRVFSDPLYANLPRGKPWFLFKRFGFRQMVFMKDELFLQEIKHGNALPILRLAAGGMAAGAGIIWAKEQVTAILEGRKPGKRVPKPILREILENLGSVGAFGMIGDIFESEDSNDVYRALRFALTPVHLADAEALLGTSKKLSSDLSKDIPTLHALRRAGLDVTKILGAIPKRAARNKTYNQWIRTEKENKNRISAIWSRERDDIFEDLLDGNTKAARYRIMNWNHAFPEKPFTNKDVGSKEFLRWHKRKKEKSTP